jgi:hypothetical protein
MSLPIKIKHIFTLTSGQQFTAEAHYRNVPALVKTGEQPYNIAYIETLSSETPNVPDASLYHAWKLEDGSTLSAWYIPEKSIVSAVCA